VWQISKRGGVGSERKNLLPRRLPNFLFPHYRSKRKFVATPVQRVAVGFSFVSLAKREESRSQRAVKPLSGVILAKKRQRTAGRNPRSIRSMYGKTRTGTV